MSIGHDVIKVRDIESKIMELKRDIEFEKKRGNPVEAKRLIQAQACLIYTKRTMTIHRGLIENPNRRIVAS